MKTSIQEHYEVNKNTMPLLSVAHPDYDTIALEPNFKCYVRKPPLQLIKLACLEGGSTYEGRRAAVVYQTGVKHKVPIPVDQLEQIYAFPTHSPKEFECAWIFPNHIRLITPYIVPNHPKQTKILFTNFKHIILPVSYYTIEKQLQRSSYMMIRVSHRLSEPRLFPRKEHEDEIRSHQPILPLK
ncbi:competence protein ComK [Bacillaceae bacterium IKA-2]|nr:competence protein ComK [Bacillaceae bacterium IKA-2]